MGLALDRVVSIGRSLTEYAAMFRLTPPDLEDRILGVADGPASFNAELRALDRRVVSIDPIYDLPLIEIERQSRAAIDEVVRQMAARPENWQWSWHRSPEALRRHRHRVLDRFTDDFEAGRKDGRYVAAALPELPFPERAFDLALCSHFLLLYAGQLDYRFHVDSLRELLRVAHEVRIYPTLTLEAEPSPHLEPLLRDLRAAGFDAEVLPSEYQLQRGESGMLRVWRHR
ncbi:MAG TPA: SAM-dependent methyltransferase [Pelomicrobium sp.]|nr:SAM-dependent methyltransferase [Pelomicrobium sp.]